MRSRLQGFQGAIVRPSGAGTLRIGEFDQLGKTCFRVVCARNAQRSEKSQRKWSESRWSGQRVWPLCQKVFRLHINDPSITPEQAVAALKENFPSFQPSFNRFYPSPGGIRAGEVVLIDSMTPGGPVSTGVMILYADDRSFTFNTPQGHPECGFVSFSGHEGSSGTVVQILGLARASDPVYEAAFRSDRLHDGAGLGTCKDCDGVRVAEWSASLGCARVGPCGLSTRAESGRESRGTSFGAGVWGRRESPAPGPPEAGAAKGTATGWQVGMPRCPELGSGIPVRPEPDPPCAQASWLPQARRASTSAAVGGWAPFRVHTIAAAATPRASAASTSPGSSA